MANTANGVNTAVQSIATAYPFLQLHTAAPDSTGTTNTSAAARVAASWSVTGATATSTSKNFTGGAASGPCTHVSWWSASTAGTCGGYQALTGDQTFNSAGQYTTNSVTVTAA
jgi:hypothetical protein